MRSRFAGHARPYNLVSFALSILSILPLLLTEVICLENVQRSSLKSWAYEWGLFGGYPQASFKSSTLRPPRMNVVKWSEECESGYTLLSLRGVAVPKPAAVIVDGRGELVWMDESFGYAMNLKVQTYKHKQYLTFWSGSFGEGFGKGTYYMLDSHYQIYKEFCIGNLKAESDFHEFTITANDTALLTSYIVAPADLSCFDVHGVGWIYDSVFREVDIDTGNVLFEWHASDHFAINETFYPLGSAGRTPYHPFDFFHINSIDKTGDGNYIISSRMLHSIVCVSSTSGMVLWVLGGRRNEFADVSRGTATHFRWQHHANVQRNGMISIFDNAKWMKWYTELWDHGEISRGMLLSLDTTNMTSELIQEYTNPGLRGSPQQGSMQVLEGSGNIMVGWGYTGAFTEFSREGKLLCDTHINPSIAFSYGLVHSYRAFRAPTWIGRPNTRPDIYMRAGADRAFVSWLGSTEVEYWLLQTAEDAPIRDLVFTNSTKAEKTGFESIVEVPKGGSKYMRIVAVGRHGQVFATSKIIRTDKGTALSSGQVFLVYAGVLLSCCLVLSLFLHRKLRSIFRAGKQGLSLTFWGSRGSDGLLGRRGATEIEYMPLHND